MTRTVKQPVSSSEIARRVQIAVAAALDRKALDLLVLGVEELCDYADFFVLCSGTSERQVRAIAEAVEERLRAAELRPLHIEGEREGNWVLLDFGDFVIHVFDQDRRSFYRLDRLWSDAEEVTEEFVS